MNSKKFLLVLFFCVAIIILIYLCKMLSPLLDDVWKILVAGVPVGFALGFWGGIKWKTFELEEKQKFHAEKEKLEAEKERFKETGRF